MDRLTNLPLCWSTTALSVTSWSVSHTICPLIAGFCMFVLSLVKKHYRLQFYMVSGSLPPAASQHQGCWVINETSWRRVKCRESGQDITLIEMSEAQTIWLHGESFVVDTKRIQLVYLWIHCLISTATLCPCYWTDRVNKRKFTCCKTILAFVWVEIMKIKVVIRTVGLKSAFSTNTAQTLETVPCGGLQRQHQS